jgi:hypothetical protein
MEDAHGKAADVERAVTKKLRKIQPTTVAGVMAVTAYFLEHIDRFPDCGWISKEETWDDPNWFEHGLIRNLAAALAKIEADRSLKPTRHLEPAGPALGRFSLRCIAIPT